MHSQHDGTTRTISILETRLPPGTLKEFDTFFWEWRGAAGYHCWTIETGAVVTTYEQIPHHADDLAYVLQKHTHKNWETKCLARKGGMCLPIHNLHKAPLPQSPQLFNSPMHLPWSPLHLTALIDMDSEPPCPPAPTHPQHDTEQIKLIVMLRTSAEKAKDNPLVFMRHDRKSKASTQSWTRHLML